MKQKRNYTLTEQEENKIVNQIYNKKILLIKKLLGDVPFDRHGLMCTS